MGLVVFDESCQRFILHTLYTYFLYDKTYTRYELTINNV